MYKRILQAFAIILLVAFLPISLFAKPIANGTQHTAGGIYSIGVAKTITSINLEADGSYTVSYLIVVRNMGNFDLYNVQVTDDLVNTFPFPVIFTVVGPPSCINTLVANTGYNGSTNISLLNAQASTLAVGEGATITFTVNIFAPAGVWGNIAVANATDLLNTVTIADSSDWGTAVDFDQDGDPTNNTNYCYVFTTEDSAQFSFRLAFEDADGNTDTLTLGYDSLATDSIDISYGEINTISYPLNDIFDVRISNRVFDNNWMDENDTINFYLKKQIATNQCEFQSTGGDYGIIQINIKAANWPVTIHSSGGDFTPFCRDGSLLTSVHPGGWWDTGGEIYLMNGLDSAELIKSQYYYLDGTDSVFVYWFVFGNYHQLLDVSVPETNANTQHLQLFPNPVNNHLGYITPENFGSVTRYNIYSMNGQLVQSYNPLSANIDVSNLCSGLYTIVMVNKQGQYLNSKFVKQ